MSVENNEIVVPLEDSQVVEETKVDPTPENENELNDSTETVETKLPKRNVKAQIDKLTREKHELRAARDKAEAKIAEYERLLENPKTDFADDEERIEYITDKKLAKKEAELAIGEVEQNTIKERTANIEHSTVMFEDIFPDIRQVNSDTSHDVRVPNDVIDFISDSEVGAGITYEIMKKPDLAKRLTDMTPNARARFLERLENKYYDILENPPAKEDEVEEEEGVSLTKAAPKKPFQPLSPKTGTALRPKGFVDIYKPNLTRDEYLLAMAAKKK